MIKNGKHAIMASFSYGGVLVGQRLCGTLLFFVLVHAAGVPMGSEGAEGTRHAAPKASGSVSMLRGTGSKRTRSPRHMIDADDAEDTSNVCIDPALEVLETETDFVSEIPWRARSPHARRHEGWKSWNSAESEPFLDFLDANHDLTAKTARADFLCNDNETSGQELDLHSDESEETFLFHAAPVPEGPTTQRAGWTKMDSQASKALQLDGKVPVGVDKDSRDFVKHTVGQLRMGRPTQVRSLIATAQMARRVRLAKEASGGQGDDAPLPLQRTTQKCNIFTHQSGAAAGASSDTDRSGGDGTDSELPNISARSVLLRGMPLRADETQIREALMDHGEINRVVLQRAVGVAHVIFTRPEASTSVLRSKRLMVMGETVDVIRGPNNIGTSSKKGINPTTLPSKPLHGTDGQANGFVSSRIVGKVDDFTFGTGIRMAKYWVEREFVEGNTTADLTGAAANRLGKQENIVAVYNLPPGANETSLRALFAECGTIKSVSLHDIVAGESQYALVEFTHVAAVRAAVADVDGLRRGGRVLRVKARGVVKDEYDMMKQDFSNMYAQLGASNAQAGHK